MKPWSPCPFCRSIELRIGGSSGTGYYVVCRTCGCHGPKTIMKQDAADSWNRRKEPTDARKTDSI